MHRPLTGLANQREFDLCLDRGNRGRGRRQPFLHRVARSQWVFKPVNDAHGHAVSDLLLCEIAERLRGACGRHAVVARQGGDELAILAPADRGCSKPLSPTTFFQRSPRPIASTVV
ncbi:diguanylate cyclase [Sphingopyxis sp.]|uniref:diguanylate cyclase domain-containing protein n=1 Tax=Sphingopyxis sp. TaxID=1908224 RepID=UPI00344CC5CE|nr:diguanylate cyclase [Sphingopyxis sp.]